MAWEEVMKRTSRKRARALKRRDATRRSADIDEATALLIEGLEQLATLLVEVRAHRHGGAGELYLDLGLAAKMFVAPKIIRAVANSADPYPVDTAIKSAMADIGHRLAARLSYDELHNTIERIAGDSSRLDWGARFTPICSALNGCRTADGEIWIT
jgi:hypothetical protein